MLPDHVGKILEIFDAFPFFGKLMNVFVFFTTK